MKSVYLFLLCTGALFGQSYGLLPGTPRAQFLDSSGRPVAGGCVFTYLSGTSTLTPSWQDSNGAAANSNPVQLDSGGRANIWLNQALSYKILLTGAPLSGSCSPSNFGTGIWTVDGVTAIGGSGGGGGGGSFLPLAGGTMTGSILTGTGNAFDLGSSISSFRSLYLGTGLYMGATQILNSTGDATLHNVTVTGTCTGCGGAGTFLPLAGGTMTGNILVTPTDTVNLGSVSSELNKVYVKDITISGSCSGAGCGGGGSFLPLSGGTMSGNIQADAIGTLSLGSSSIPFGSVFALGNVSSRKLQIYDPGDADLTNANWAVVVNASLVNHIFRITDPAGLNFLYMSNLSFGSSANPFTSINSSFYPGSGLVGADSTYDLGKLGDTWRSLYLGNGLFMGTTQILDSASNASVHDLTITGTCSGCPGSGSGTYLPIAGGTMTGSILASAINTVSVGSKPTPLAGGYFMANASTRKVELYDNAAGDLNGIFFTLSASVNSFAKQFDLKDDAGTAIFSISTVSGSTVNRRATLYGSLSPTFAGTYDLGDAQAWRNIFFNGTLTQNGTTRMDNAGNTTVNNLTITGSCTGCSGGGSFLPLAGGTMSGNISSSSIGTLSLGSTTNPFGSVYALTNLSSRKLQLYDPGDTNLANANWSVTADASLINHKFHIKDTAGFDFFYMTNLSGGSSLSPHASIAGSFFPGSGESGANNSYDLGVVGANWRSLYLGTSLVMGSQTVINNLAQFVGAGVDVGANGIQAGNYNVFGGFIGQSQTVTGALGCGALHFVSGIFVGCF